MPEDHSRRLAQVALIWRGTLGPMAFRRVEAHFGSPAAALAADPGELAVPSLHLYPEQIAALSGPARDLEGVGAEIAELETRGLRVLCDFEADYPQILRQMRDCPPVLCLAGRLLPTDEPAVAIVGTRTPTPEGFRLARALAEACAAEDLTVVSGLALGCDTGAHQGALSGGGRTIAVLGSGLYMVSPRENQELARLIAERGAVLSEQPPFAEPSTPHLLARNRLQVGLSQGVIVVQAGESGGAMQTAEQAFKTGRLVYAALWPSEEEKAAGNRALLTRGARPLAGPEAVPNLARALYVHQEESRRRPASESVQGTLFAPESPPSEGAGTS